MPSGQSANMPEVATTSTNAARGQELVRDLKLTHASAIVVGSIIGTGIFLVPTDMIRAAGSPGLVYLAWIVGGILSFFGALTYAELGAMKPEAGGEYVYIRDAYGPTSGFVFAWTWFVLAKPASIATISAGLVRILGGFHSLGFLANPVMPGVTVGTLVSIAAIVLISFINYLGVKKAGEFQFIATLLKVGIILFIVGIGFAYVHGTWSNFGTHYVGAVGGMAGFIAALVAALWAYDGWNFIASVAGEVRNPRRNIPISLIAGVAVVAALYMLVNAAVQFVMPAAAIGATSSPASDAIALAGGHWGAVIVTVGMALSVLVTLNGSIMTGARVPFAVARDGYFFRALAQIHPRFHTPSVSIAVQAVMGIILLLVGRTFQALFSLTIFAEFLFYALAAASIFVFRRREPQAPRPYRTWGYPVVPVLFLLMSAWLLYYTFMSNLRNSLLGCALILSGVPVFYIFAARRRRLQS
jgi:APA family basic amino acid/polyamine antiporter